MRATKDLRFKHLSSNITSQVDYEFKVVKIENDRNLTLNESTRYE